MKVDSKIFQTSNGMEVLLLKRHEKYTVSFSLLINAGSIFEDEKTSGISHFYEHLLFNGTKTYPTEELLRKRHQELGLSVGASTNYDFIELSGSFPIVSIREALTVICEMVFDSLIAERMIEKERGIILEEERTRGDNNNIHLWNRAFEVRFKKGSSLQLPREGKSDSIKSLDSSTIKQFYKKYCVPANSILIIASNKSYEYRQSLLEDILRKSPSGKKVKKPILSNKDMTSYVASAVNKPTQQIYSLISFPSFAGEDLYIIWQYGFLLELLYEEFNKVLKQERGLVYELSCSSIGITKNVSFSYVQFVCDPSNFNTVVSLIFKKIKEMKEGSIDAMVFERIREAGNKILPMGFDSISGVMGWVTNSFYRYKKVYSPEEFIKSRNKVTEKDLKRVAENVFNYSKMNFVTLGPIGQDYLEKIVKKSVAIGQ